MVAKNDITGDNIQTKGVTTEYRDNYDNIFRKNKKTDADKIEEQAVPLQELEEAAEEFHTDDLEEYKRQAQEIWNDSCTSPRKK